MNYNKGPAYFSLEKIAVTRSLDSEKNVFFLPKGGKIQLYFFFLEKVDMPFTRLFRRSIYIKGGKAMFFFINAIFNPILSCIFFLPGSVFFSLYFFFWKSLSLTHSLISNVCIFYFRCRTIEYDVFTHLLDFAKNVTKINFS